jgi:hypothetical protein
LCRLFWTQVISPCLSGAGVAFENPAIFIEVRYNEVGRWFFVAKRNGTPKAEKGDSEKQAHFDYDGFWKDLIKRFFYLLLKRALPELYERANVGKRPRFLDKEFRDILNTGDPEIHTSPHFADFVLEVPLKNGKAEWVLLHIEAQGPKGGNLAVRMHHYECLIYAHYLREPIALAIVTDTRPKKEASFYAYSACGTELIYRYNNLVLRELDDGELLESENPIDLVFYAAKCALDCKEEELQKYHYLRKVTGLLAERGWSMEDKRDLMLFAERIINLEDKKLVRQYVEYQKELNEEGKIVYVSLLEREIRQEYLEKGERQKALTTARKMLARRMPVDVIADLTELPEDEIRGLMN